MDTVGNVDAGILAASWSPDDSLLVLATGPPFPSRQFNDHSIFFFDSVGDHKLILMTNTFDIISENTIEREDFGEGK